MKLLETKFSNTNKIFIWKSYDKLQSPEFEKRINGNEGIQSTIDRPEYSRDYARILYSSSFRRLQGKMQVLGIESTAFFRNRLTHSLEVAQIAKSIARVLSNACGEKKGKKMYQDQELCLLEAAALAHDIGHPAFGHKGETVLDEIAQKYGHRFEGNAQNYRAVNLLDRHGTSCKGLNLTYRTLLAINKYIVKENAEVKKFMFADDYDSLMEFRKNNNIESERTLDVQIIELADDIAYAVHDLEDALSLNLCKIEDFEFELEKEGDKNVCRLFNQIIAKAKKEMGCSCAIENNQENSHLFRKTLVSILTNTFVRKLSVAVIPKEDCIKYGIRKDSKELTLEANYKQLCKCLSKIIFECAIRKSNIAEYEAKGEIVIKSLFNIYSNKEINKGFNLLPPDYRPKENASAKEISQKVIDYIAGMMDTFAISEYEKLTGKDFNNIDISDIPTIFPTKINEEENKIWIRIVSNNYCLLKDKDELIEELRQVCVVQEKKVWHPAACTGFEFVSEILFNSTLSEFVQNIIVGGLAWDAIKKACAKILESLNNFAQKNNEFDFWNWKLCFDDVTIKISEKLSYAQIVNIYQKFPYHLENIKGKDISQITQIELMYYESIEEEAHKTEIKKVCEVSDEELIWKIKYLCGCEKCYYIPVNETLISI